MDEIDFCEIQVTGRDIGGYRLQADRLAVGPSGVLLVAQVVAPAAQVKGLAGVLSNNGKLAEVRLTRGTLSNDEYPHGRHFRELFRSEHGYRRLGAVHLGYGVAHALLVAQQPGLLADASEEALWRELSGPRYTTPLLRGWTPHVGRKLREKTLLVDCLGHRTRAALLTATTEDLDAIAADGIRTGHLRLERGMAA